MDRRHFLLAAGVVAVGLAAPRAGVAAQGAALPPPALPGDKSLEAALRARQNQRSFDARPLPDEVLSGFCGRPTASTGPRPASIRPRRP